MLSLNDEVNAGVHHPTEERQLAECNYTCFGESESGIVQAYAVFKRNTFCYYDADAYSKAITEEEMPLCQFHSLLAMCEAAIQRPHGT